MLRIDPKMLPRLDELQADLLARRDRALNEGWAGEMEGLGLTLTFPRQSVNRHNAITIRPCCLACRRSERLDHNWPMVR